MNKRKAIAVVAADVFNDYMNRIFIGISEQCKALDYDAYAFIMAFNMDGSSLVQNGEENIFNLIKKGVVEGVILLGGNFASQTLVDKMAEKFSSLEVPLVALDYDFGFCESIYAEDAPLIEKMTDHLIEHHGCKNILCLTGPKGITPAMSRLEGYKRSMEKHGLEIGSKSIIFGDFWKPAALRLAKEIANGKRPIPDAVVCANDVMAMNLCNTLINLGIKVPEQVMVTGYDGSRDAIDNIPSISTIYPENSHLGAKAVCYIHKQLTGEDAEVADISSGTLILAQSCSCNDGLGYLVSRRENYSKNIERFERFYNKSGMLEDLMKSEIFDDLLQKTVEYGYLLNGVDTYMLCLCKNWDDVENSNEDDYIRVGYSKKMEVKMIMNEGNAIFNNIEYNSKVVIPPVMEEYSSEPSMYFLLPVHFMDRCFGYSVFKFSDISYALSMIFVRWNRNINIALEFLRVRTKLTSLNQRISLASIRDTLTGMYNRKGFARFSENMFQRAVNEKKQFLVIVGDLDMLKTINDNYGHIEGDNAITIAANAMNTCCKSGEMCARMGGDEYAVFGVGDYTDEIVTEYTGHIRNFCDRYNASSGKEYNVGVSLGFYCAVPEENDTIDSFYNLADEKMYEDKFRRKKNRR